MTPPNAAELQAEAVTQREALTDLEPPPDYASDGGWLEGPTFAATGRFSLAQSDSGAWWFVTPTGRPFWSLGLARLPWPNEAEQQIYRQVIEQKWGGRREWAVHTQNRLHTWGFNSLGLQVDARFTPGWPHLRRLQTGPVNTVPDVFAPAWRQQFESAWTLSLREAPVSTQTLALVVDDGIDWRNLELFAAPPEAALRQAWVDFLQPRFDGLNTVNHFFRSNFADWDAVARLQPEQIPAWGPAREQVDAFSAHYAETYFATVRQVLQQLAPHTLHFTGQFAAQLPNPAIVEAAGRHCDAICLRCDAPFPQRDELHAWVDLSGGRPLLITGHSLPRRQYTAEERRRFYAKYVGEWANAAFSLGAHWDGYLDGTEDESQSGLVNQLDQPYPELVEALLHVRSQFYRWHQRSRWFDTQQW